METILERASSPMTDIDLTQSIADWLKAAPKTLLVGLHDESMRDQAALELSERIVAELTMSYPEICEATAPRFLF